jgi:hypothetical protein
LPSFYPVTSYYSSISTSRQRFGKRLSTADAQHGRNGGITPANERRFAMRKFFAKRADRRAAKAAWLFHDYYTF